MHKRKSTGTECPIEELKNKQILIKSQRLRAAGGFVSEDAFNQRKMFLNR